MTRNIVPRSDNEGMLGTPSKKWSDIRSVKTQGLTEPVMQFADLASDFNTASTSFVDVSGLAGLPMVAGGTYYFRFLCLVQTSATSEGITLTINASGAVSSIRYFYQFPTSASAWTQEAVAALQGGSVSTTGPGTTPRFAILEGKVVADGAANLVLQVRTETGGAQNSTVLAGSFGILRQTA